MVAAGAAVFVACGCRSSQPGMRQSAARTEIAAVLLNTVSSFERPTTPSRYRRRPPKIISARPARLRRTDTAWLGCCCTEGLALGQRDPIGFTIPLR